MALSELLYLTKSSIFAAVPLSDIVDATNHSFSSLHLALSIGWMKASNYLSNSVGRGSNLAFSSCESILNSP